MPHWDEHRHRKSAPSKPITWESGSWHIDPRDVPPRPSYTAQRKRFQRKGTVGQCRHHDGLTDLLIYCTNWGRYCHHSATLPLSRFPDHLSLSDLEPRCRCTKCGHLGADVRPDWSPHTKKKNEGRVIPWVD